MLLKTRPRLAVRAPPRTAPGETFEVEIEVDAHEPVPIDALEALFAGTEHVRFGQGKQPIEANARLCQLTARLAGPGTLARGRAVYRATFAVPEAATPSRHTDHVHVRYAVLARARIPWWPDAYEEAEIDVAPRSSAPLAGGPQRVARLAPDGPFELTVANDAVPAGGTVYGAAALGDPARWAGLRAQLEYTESAGALNAFVSPGDLPARTTAAEYDVSLAGAAPGRAIALSVPVPEDALPSFVSRLWSLEWSLCLTALAAPPNGADESLRLPLRVWRPAPGAAAPPAPPLPKIGAARVHEAWLAAAAQLGVPLDADGCFHVGAGEVEAVVRREERGTKGPLFVGELRWPALGIGLHVRPAPLLIALFGRDFPLGDERFDAHHAVSGRYARQVTSFMTPLLEALQPFAPLQMDDAGARVQAPATTPAELVEFVRRVQALARAAGVALRAVPPPPSMEATRAVWDALAARLGGPLRCGDMSVAGRWAGHAAEVATRYEWDGQPYATVVLLRPDPPLAQARAASFQWADDPGAPGAHGPDTELEPGTPWPPAATALLAELRRVAGARRVSAAAEELTAELDAPLAYPARALACLDLLAALAAALADGHGPYR
ncbi:MAG TPA: hypothetical protein VG389_08860 [Myxococcota bacterium]|jgi:hypothetical protein|nr:hypothetical protein [Myxococcota bacterium]